MSACTESEAPHFPGGIPAAPVRALPTPLLMLVTAPHPHLPEIVDAAVAGGVTVVQVRHKGASPADLMQTAQAVGEAVAGRALLTLNSTFLTYLDPGDEGTGSAALDIALAVGADGLHLAECAVLSAGERRRMPPGMLLGRSVHSMARLPEGCAVGERLNYIVAGTLFPSTSHPGAQPAGLEFLRTACAASSLPVVAIGGITPERVALCREAGAAGVAVLSPILYAADPERAARAFRAALDRCPAN